MHRKPAADIARPLPHHHVDALGRQLGGAGDPGDAGPGHDHAHVNEPRPRRDRADAPGRSARARCRALATPPARSAAEPDRATARCAGCRARARSAPCTLRAARATQRHETRDAHPSRERPGFGERSPTARSTPAMRGPAGVEGGYRRRPARRPRRSRVVHIGHGARGWPRRTRSLPPRWRPPRRSTSRPRQLRARPLASDEFAIHLTRHVPLLGTCALPDGTDLYATGARGPEPQPAAVRRAHACRCCSPRWRPTGSPFCSARCCWSGLPAAVAVACRLEPRLAVPATITLLVSLPVLGTLGLGQVYPVPTAGLFAAWLAAWATRLSPRASRWAWWWHSNPASAPVIPLVPALQDAPGTAVGALTAVVATGAGALVTGLAALATGGVVARRPAQTYADNASRPPPSGSPPTAARLGNAVVLGGLRRRRGPACRRASRCGGLTATATAPGRAVAAAALLLSR
ncbi:hypothetical protein HBB16_16840 [Pseudonocardia sp. MCCB 268]|nr:hypothetical protein [Pseudonocardia cytotoxica]